MKNQDGMTIIELIVAISLSVVITSIMLGLTLTFYGNTVRSQIQSEMAVNGHFALRSLVEDIRLGSNISTTNTINDDNAPSGGWSTDSAGSTIIINRPAVDTDEDIIYDDTTGLPYANEFIYYINNGVLRKRVLKNTNAIGNSAKTTCPDAAVVSGCPKDAQLVKNVASFSFILLDSQNNETTDATLARSIKFNLSLRRNAFANPVIVNNTITTKLRN